MGSASGVVLLLDYWKEHLIMGIGDQIGEALKVDHLTLGKMRGKYARVCVNIDLSKPLVKGIRSWER